MSLSFVVQGPIVAQTTEKAIATKEVLASIRKYYPDSEIVLSTWENSDVTGLDFDKVVLSKDPGPIMYGIYPNNIRRLIVSTVAGVDVCTNAYVVKSRTDIGVTDSKLLKYLPKLKKQKASSYSLFDHKVISTTTYVRNAVRRSFGFHPSDIFLFGHRNDIRSLFDHDIEPIEEHMMTNVIKDGEIGYGLKCVPEQYLMIGLIHKRLGINIEYRDEWVYMGLRDFKFSEKLLFKNFLFFPADSIGVALPERLVKNGWPESIYTKTETSVFRRLYNIPIIDNLFATIRSVIYYCRYFTLKAIVANFFKSSVISKLKWKF